MMRLRLGVVYFPMSLTAIAAALLAVTGCGDAVSQGGRLSVVTTIYPVTYFTERVGGDRIQVTSLVPSGVEAHDYEPKPSDLRALLRADLVVYSHTTFEAWMADALKSRPADRPVVQAVQLDEAANAPAGDVHGHDSDPHVWLNPEEAAAMVGRIRDGLMAADAEGDTVYEANAAALMANLEALGGRISAALSDCRLRTVVVSHAAYGHLLEDYGIEQVALAGLQAEGGETGPRTVAEVTDRIRAEGIKHILVEPILSADLAERVAQATRSAVLPFHPLESLTQPEKAAGDTYFTVMERNLQSLRTALGCSA